MNGLCALGVLADIIDNQFHFFAKGKDGSQVEPVAVDLMGDSVCKGLGGDKRFYG